MPFISSGSFPVLAQRVLSAVPPSAVSSLALCAHRNLSTDSGDVGGVFVKKQLCIL